MTNGIIRPLAICVFRHGDRILAEKAYDPTEDEFFYRPLGGGIEFGETSHDAVIREIREEIGAEITDLRLIGTLENIFTFGGEPGHEIVRVYDATFCDPNLYARDGIPGREDDGHTFSAQWLPLASFAPDSPPLYPDGLLELLRNPDAHQG